MATTPTQERPTGPEIVQVKRTNWLPLVLGVLVIAAGGLLLWWAFAGGGEETRVDKVEASIEAVGSGTYDEWSADFADSFYANLPTNADVTHEEFFDYNQGIGARTAIVESCTEVAGSVRCTVRHENDLFDAAGIAPELVENYLFNDDDQINQIFTEGDTTTYLQFYIAYPAWLAEAYPEVHDQLIGGSSTMILFSPDTADLWLAHVDEFVAQSDVYPKS